MKEKRELFEKYLQNRERGAYEVYKRKRGEVKRLIKEAKREADERWGSNLMRDFERNKKMFWKEVKRERKENVGRAVGINDSDGVKLVNEVEVNRRWAGYFEGLLNVVDDREAVIVGVGNGRRMPVCERCNDNIEYAEICEAVRKLKGGKSPGIDEVAVEFLKRGGECVLEWLVRMFNGCFREGKVPKEWKSAVIVPLYKGKGDRCECANYR